MTHPARHWSRLADGRIQCDLCPRRCRMREGQRGLCYVRGVEDDALVLHTWGRSSGFCVDPIEKKPLNHFLPGTPVLSFGTAGCNLACKFCQNWDISKSREDDSLAAAASPADLAHACGRLKCTSIAYTYNDPVIFLEYALDVAAACREVGVRSVAVSAGYISPAARVEFFEGMDAANIDLKAFTRDFYRSICGGELEPVKETLEYLVHESDTWVEITTLLIPGHNDGDAELHALAAWVREALGAGVPLHLSAFHPDWKMRDVPGTPAATLHRARAIALGEGLRHVYTGNIDDVSSGSTWCPGCGALLIERNRYQLGRWGLDADGACAQCGETLPGVFDPGGPGDWGARRLPVRFY
ncbi:MAG: AmmeMemoRadiSam system radical SAM enzyme [Gammaproteobacteria bacterium AqS3]|nr:AmmeMemoRadiSam system radical SAM enzyme [Gammaproteobacteria bacterium AqS3]